MPFPILPSIPRGLGRAVFSSIHSRSAAYRLRSVAPDSLHRTPFHGLFAKTLFLGILRLLEEVRMAAIVIPREIRRRSLTAEITVYTLIIYVEFPCHILWIFVCNVSHKPNGLSFRLN